MSLRNSECNQGHCEKIDRCSITKITQTPVFRFYLFSVPPFAIVALRLGLVRLLGGSSGKGSLMYSHTTLNAPP